jgi:hypothetical protein
MTMVRAWILLGVSTVVTALAVVLVLSQVDFVELSSTHSRASGAGLGDNPAPRPTQVGGDILATITAAAKTLAPGTTPPPGRTPTAAASVTVVKVGESVEFRGARYTVTQVLDPEPPGFFATAAGKRRVAVELSQEALSASSTYDFTFFALRDATGTDYTWAISNSKPEFDRGTLKPGESHTGWLVFQVPIGTDPVLLVVAPGGAGQRVPLVDLRK